MLNPFINLIDTIIDLINLLLFIWIVLGLLIHFDIINRSQPLIARIYSTLGMLIEPMLNPIRRQLRKLPAGFQQVDISPIILILLLMFINDALHTWFYTVQPYEYHSVSLSDQIDAADEARAAKAD
jgi:YggT family protein